MIFIGIKDEHWQPDFIFYQKADGSYRGYWVSLLQSLLLSRIEAPTLYPDRMVILDDYDFMDGNCVKVRERLWFSKTQTNCCLCVQVHKTTLCRLQTSLMTSLEILLPAWCSSIKIFFHPLHFLSLTSHNKMAGRGNGKNVQEPYFYGSNHHSPSKWLCGFSFSACACCKNLKLLQHCKDEHMLPFHHSLYYNQ